MLEGIFDITRRRLFVDELACRQPTQQTNRAGATSTIDFSKTVAGPWLAETLAGLRRPEGLARVVPGKSLQGTLRPYQQAGVQWLYLLTRLRLGACLADDMGLGKTIQVLSLLLVLKEESSDTRKPSLVIAPPASLLANWAAEIARFAPNLKAVVAHPSAMSAEQLKSDLAEALAVADLVITSYGTLARIKWKHRCGLRDLRSDGAYSLASIAGGRVRPLLPMAGHRSWMVFTGLFAAGISGLVRRA